MFDLASLGTKQDSVKMELLHPETNEVLTDEEGNAFTISLLSSDTNKYKSEFSKVIKAANKTKHDMTTQEQEKKACDLLASITTDAYFVFDKKPFTFSEAAIAELYLKPQFTWLREQVEQFIRDRSNFI